MLLIEGLLVLQSRFTLKKIPEILILSQTSSFKSFNDISSYYREQLRITPLICPVENKVVNLEVYEINYWKLVTFDVYLLVTRLLIFKRDLHRLSQVLNQ